MNILQFESLNMEFIWKRYEINKFESLKYKIRSNSVITKKGQGPVYKKIGVYALNYRMVGWFSETRGSL
jgi:hypothetical protein